MSDLATQYMDLLASGDAARIKCVVNATLGAGVTGGVGAAVAFAPANIVPGAGTGVNGVAIALGALAGALIGAKVGMKACAAGTEGSLDKIFVGQVSDDNLDHALAQLGKKLQMSQAQLSPLVKAAAFELMTKGPGIASYGKPDRAPLLLLSDRLSAAGIT